MIDKLKPINLKDADRLISTVCESYRKELNPKVVNILLEKKKGYGGYAYGSSLWLTMVGGEFLLLDKKMI